MFSFFFKTKYTIREMNTTELDKLIQLQPRSKSLLNDESIDGFEFLLKDTASYQMTDGMNNKNKYSTEKNLKHFEKQNKVFEQNHEYDINIVAEHKNQIKGILALKWYKSKLGKGQIWNYESRFIDVHEKYRHKGIATKMLTHLKEMPQVQGKVLRFRPSNTKGIKFITHKLEKIFSNSESYVLSKVYWNYKEVPEKPGYYLNK